MATNRIPKMVDTRGEPQPDYSDHPLPAASKRLLQRMVKDLVVVRGDRFRGYESVDPEGKILKVSAAIFKALQHRNYVTRRGPPFAVSARGRQAVLDAAKGPQAPKGRDE